MKQEPNNINFLDKPFRVKNKQLQTARKSLIVVVVGLIVTVLPFMEGSPLTGIWAFALLGIFVFLAGFIVFLIFYSRSKKLQTLITGENIIAHWILDEQLKKTYVNELFVQKKAKNKALFFITSFLIVIIFGIFVAVIDEGKAAMVLTAFLLISLIALFAFGMPAFFKYKNTKADGKVLIGLKFAYINGFFHNWDFPLSGLKKIKVIKKPFYGIHLTYFYTDRTFTNTESLDIPAPDNLDLTDIVLKMKQ